MAHEPLAPAVVLVVYDEAVVARVVIRFLRHLGYDVLETTCVVQALGMVRRRQPPIDLILTDAGPRGVGGAALAAAVGAESSPPQLILVVDLLSRAFERVDGLGRRIRVLRKPIDLDELELLLRMMLPALLPEDDGQTAAPRGPTSGQVEPVAIGRRRIRSMP